MNSVDPSYVEKYFYENNYMRNKAINFYLEQIKKWEGIFKSSDVQSITSKQYESLNKWFENDIVSIRKSDIFKNLNPSEVLIFINTIKRQLQIEKYNIIMNSTKRANQHIFPSANEPKN